tara:strand:- start:1021 stop:4275 length:3255 start_codon:yes stop_codon:yes gene_type:complete
MSQEKAFRPRSLWGEIGLAEWVSVLSGSPGEWKIKGKSVVGKCPYHQGYNPTCYVTPDMGVVKCFSCGKSETDPIRFLAAATSSSWTESMKRLGRVANLRLPRKVVQDMHVAELRQTIKAGILSACNTALVMAAKSKDSERHKYAVPLLDFLESRGVPTDDTLGKLPIGVLPPRVELVKHLPEDILEHSISYLESSMTGPNTGALLLAYHKSPTEITRFKLRSDFLRPDGARSTHYVPDANEETIGFFGLPFYSAMLWGAQKAGKRAMIVEGETDALAHMVEFQSGLSYEVVVACGGASVSSPDILKEYCGVSEVMLVCDHPDHGGDAIAKIIMSQTSMPVKVFSWPPEVEAKDPDEAIKKHGWETWLSALTAKRTEGTHQKWVNFKAAHVWLAGVTKAKLASLDPDDLRGQKEAIGQDGSCLREPEAQMAYARAVSKMCTLTIGTILELVVGRDDSEEGFIARILQALREEFFFIGIDGSKGSDTLIRAWHRKKKEPREWRMSRTTELYSQISQDLGSILYWLKSTVGIPQAIITTSKGGTIKIPEQSTTVGGYMQIALSQLCGELPTTRSLTETKAGAHYVEHDFGAGPEPCWVLVNGYEVYIGRYTDECTLEWTCLDGPRLGDRYFNIIRAPWSTEIASCLDLEHGNTVKHSDVYDFLVSVIYTGWTLKGGLEDCEYLAAAMMVNSISSCLPRQLYTLINGARGTGKSKLLDIIAGSDPTVRLLECSSDVQSGYSTAGFRKDMNNCALGAALDEFEDKGDDPHSKAVRGILTDIRGLTNSPACRITRGNVESKEATVYTLRCQIWAGAINYLREEADVSRFMQIHTVRCESKSDPHTTMLNTFGQETIQKYRRALSTGMYRLAPEYLKKLTELRATYSQPTIMDALSKEVGATVPSRFLDGVVVTAAMVACVGLNPHSYILRVIKSKKELLEIITTSTQEQDLLDTILSSKVEHKRPGSESRNTSVRTILSDPTARHSLIEMDCGLSYVEDLNNGNRERWLIVMWPDVVRQLLRGSNRYGKDTAERLKRMGDSSPNTKNYHTVRRRLGGLTSVLRPGITASDITIYDITEMLDSWDQRGTT